MRKFFIFFPTFFCITAVFFILLANPVFARIGVGVGTGKIQPDEPLKAGGIYTLPSVVIINTGTEPSDYGMRIQYHNRSEMQQLWPDKEWFQFEPETFYLEPGQAQEVKIKLVLPLKEVEPGDYFCYLEGMPIIKEESGGAGAGAKIGVAAASKLYFTVEPANIWQALIHRTKTFFQAYAPWPMIFSYIILGAVILSILIKIFKKFFKFNIGISVKTKEEPVLAGSKVSEPEVLEPFNIKAKSVRRVRARGRKKSIPKSTPKKKSKTAKPKRVRKK